MKKRTLFLVALLGIHLLLLVNLRFTAWPEMLSFPYLRNNGFLIYKDMIHPYPPVLTMALSFIYSIFGYGLQVLQAITWSLILIIDLLVFLIVRQLTKSDKYALLSLAFYVFLQPFLEGNMLWFDLAIVPPILVGTYFLLRYPPSRKALKGKALFLAGLSFGIAALIKQTAGIFLISSGLYYVVKERKVKNLVYLFLGPAILSIPLLIRLWQEKALTDFFNWTLIYPLTEWTKFPGYVQMDLTSSELKIVLLLFLPLVLILFKVREKIAKDKNIQLLLLFLAGALVLVYPRFSFFHFQPELCLGRSRRGLSFK